MFDIKFEINGRSVNPNNIGDAIEKAALELVREHITKNFGSVKCPEHHLGAKIIAKGRNADNLSFDVSGCCQKLIDEVSKKLE